MVWRPQLPRQRVELLGTVQVLHEHLTTSLCQTVFQQTRTTERDAVRTWRPWRRSGPKSSCAPQSLTQAIEEAATGNGAGWPRVQATPEAFFERCQTLHWRFFATLYEAFVAQVLPQAMPGYAAPTAPCVSTSRRSGSSMGRAWMRSPIGSSCCGRCARVSCPAV